MHIYLLLVSNQVTLVILFQAKTMQHFRSPKLVQWSGNLANPVITIKFAAPNVTLETSAAYSATYSATISATYIETSATKEL